MSEGVETGTIETKIPARLDRLPWSRFHWMVIVGLGTAWILDGLEVNVVGSISSRICGTGRRGRPERRPTCPAGRRRCTSRARASGAIVFGQLTDRFGRKRLFMMTLAHLPDRHGADRVHVLAGLVLRLPLPHRHGHRRRVQRDQLGDRRADPRQPARARGRVDQRQLLARRHRRLAAGGGAAQHRDLPGQRRLAAVVRARRGDRAGGPARAPQRAGEPALAVHPRPRAGGREDRRRHRAARWRARPARRSPSRRASR